MDPLTPAAMRRRRRDLPSTLPVGRLLRPADVDRLAALVAELVREAGTGIVECDVAGMTEPDAASIDALARLQLAARRAGGAIRLRHCHPELVELIELAGLGDVLVPDRELGVESRGQPEERKEPRGVEEERDPGDPPA